MKAAQCLFLNSSRHETRQAYDFYAVLSLTTVNDSYEISFTFSLLDINAVPYQQTDHSYDLCSVKIS